MQGQARIAIAALALSIAILPTSPRQARAEIDCAVLNAKIAEMEKPIKNLREVVKGLAAVLALNSEKLAQQEDGYSPAYELLSWDDKGALSRKIATMRAQAAANEPVLRDLRALRIKHCSGQQPVIAHVAPPSADVIDRPSPQYLPGTRVYGSPVVPYQRTKLRSREHTSPGVASYDPGQKHVRPKAKKKHGAKTHKRSHTQKVHKKSGKVKKPRMTRKKHKFG